ncbi:hypothetical protein JCM10908_004332 [Rhodotorula pacifica]|uniref:uncharacterized protein n=1 Tax=Rhodotorula pacifica TaxID=1495444 RepID=UPI0031769FDE
MPMFKASDALPQIATSRPRQYEGAPSRSLPATFATRRESRAPPLPRQACRWLRRLSDKVSGQASRRSSAESDAFDWISEASSSIESAASDGSGGDETTLKLTSGFVYSPTIPLPVMHVLDRAMLPQHKDSPPPRPPRPTTSLFDEHPSSATGASARPSFSDSFYQPSSPRSVGSSPPVGQESSRLARPKPSPTSSGGGESSTAGSTSAFLPSGSRPRTLLRRLTARSTDSRSSHHSQEDGPSAQGGIGATVPRGEAYPPPGLSSRFSDWSSDASRTPSPASCSCGCCCWWSSSSESLHTTASHRTHCAVRKGSASARHSEPRRQDLEVDDGMPPRYNGRGDSHGRTE